MLKRIKEIFESIAYAGLQPGGRKAQATQRRDWLAPLRSRLDRFLSGSASSDPLYLSNRTAGQKIKFWAVVALPCLILVAGIALGVMGYFSRGSSFGAAPDRPSNAEIANRMLPDLNKDLHIASNQDLVVEDVHVVQGAQDQLAGVARNNTDHAIQRAQLTFELTDAMGSRQGAVSTELENIGAKSAMPFRFAIPQHGASFALVREVHID
jgi:hypothetical protein